MLSIKQKNVLEHKKLCSRAHFFCFLLVFVKYINKFVAITINHLKINLMKKLSLFLIFAFISIFNANAQQPPLPNISNTTSYQYVLHN